MSSKKRQATTNETIEKLEQELDLIKSVSEHLRQCVKAVKHCSRSSEQMSPLLEMICQFDSLLEQLAFDIQ